MKVRKEDYAVIVERYTVNKETLKKIGTDYRVSAGRISQIIKQFKQEQKLEEQSKDAS